MNINKIVELKLKIKINDNLYQKNVIDYNVYYQVNEKLLKMLKDACYEL